MITPPALRAVSHSEVPVPHVDLKPGMTWWQQLLFLLVSAAIAGGSSWAGSHWGGVTHDQLTDELAKQEKKLGARIDSVGAQLAKDSDDMRKYVDEKTAPKVVKKLKKPKPTEE